MTAEDFDVDYIFITHEHADHYDSDMLSELIPLINPKIFAPIECEKAMKSMGLDMSNFTLVREGYSLSFDEFSVLPVPADHGELAPDALGFVFDFKFTKLYYSGDTAYSPEKLDLPIKLTPEIAILPINGEYGNLNSVEAVKLAKDLKANVVIPCHYWTFVEHGSNPLEFKKLMEKEYPECKALFMALGEGYIYEADDK